MKQNLFSLLYKALFRQVSEQLAGYKSINAANRLSFLMAIAVTPAAVKLVNELADRYADTGMTLEYFFTFVLSGTGVSAAMAIATSAGGDGKKKDAEDGSGRRTRGAGNYKPDDGLYIPNAMQHAFIEGWHGTIAEQMASITNLYDILKLDGEFYGFDAAVLTQFYSVYDILEPAYVKYSKKTATPTEVGYFKRFLEEILEYVRSVVKQVAKGRCGAGAMDVSDLNNMGFLSDKQSQGNHKPLPIPTEVPTAKFSQKGEPDKGFVIIERDANKDSEQASGGAWPKGVKGAIIATKPVEDPDSAWHYQFVSKIHNIIDLPAAWRGKKIHFKVAYVAHANDPVNQLHWSLTQTILLLSSVED